MHAPESPFEDSIGKLLAAHELPRPEGQVVSFIQIGCWGLEHLSTTLAINTRPRLVGRELESVRLLHALDEVSREGVALAVTLSGAAGAGKTRLLEETVSIARVGGFEGRTFSVTAQPGDSDNALIARLLTARFGLERLNPRARAGHLMQQVGELFADERVEDVCYFLGTLLGLKFEPTPLVRLLSQHEFHAEIAIQSILCELFAADSAIAPVCWVLDELHNIDRSSLGKLMALVDDLRPGSLMICSARPDFFARHEHFAQLGAARHEHIELGPIDPSEVRQLLRDMVGPCANNEQELESFFAQAGLGNPGLIQELVRELWALGALQPLADQSGCYFDVDCLRAQRELSKTPDSDARLLSSLPPVLAGLLEVAALVGSVCWQGLCASLFKAAHPELALLDDESLEVAFLRLEMGGHLLRLPDSRIRGEAELIFKDPEARERLTERLPRSKHRALHRAIADWLLGKDEALQQSSELAALAAKHLLLSGSRHRAAELLLLAAHTARAHENDHLAAASYYRQGLEALADHDNRRRVDALHDFGAVLTDLGQPTAARRAFEEMRELADRLGLSAKLGAALNRLGRVHREHGDLPLAEQMFRQALQAFEHAGDARGISATKGDLGRLLWLRGETELAQRLLSVALEERKRLGDERAVAVNLAQLALVWSDLGRAATSERALGIAGELFDRSDDLRGKADAFAALATLAARRGDLPSALSLAHTGAKLSYRAKDRPRVARSLLLLGALRMKNDDLDEAKTLLQRGARLAEQIEAWRDLCEGERSLAKLALRSRDFVEARSHAFAALRLARRVHSRSLLSAALRTCADVASQIVVDPNADDRAARLYLRSIEVAKRVGHERELAKTYRAFAQHASRYPSAEVHDKARELNRISEEFFRRQEPTAA